MMLTNDTKASSETSSSSSPTLESPPSYDFATISNPSGSSTSTSPPKDTLHLFHPPPNPESLLGRTSTPAETLGTIESIERGGAVTSHDPKLQNGDVLYDWIRKQALVHPTVKIQCLGVHFETPQRDEVVQDRDGPRHRRKGQPERVVDFDFTIDVSPVFTHPDNLANIHLTSTSPSAPVCRGSVNLAYADRRTSSNEIALWKEWTTWRDDRGLPPWNKMEDWKEFWGDRGNGKGVALAVGEEEERLMEEDPRAELQDWCQRYAADPALLKDFRVWLYIWGWNLDGLKTAIKGAIQSTGYNSNHLSVNVQQSPKLVMVRPPNLLSRAVNHPVIYTFLWITLLYPLIWLWQRLHRLGGGPYIAGKITYGMKYYPPLPSTFPGETLDQASHRLNGMYKVHPELPKPTSLVPGPKGVHYLLGRKEGEWFREWEERIRMGVRMRYKGELVGGGEEDAGLGLDGY